MQHPVPVTHVQTTIYRCSFCGENLPDGRIDRRYHSSACRQKAYRWRRKLHSYASVAEKNLVDVLSYLQHEETRDDAKAEIEALISHAVKIARTYGVTIQVIRK